MTVRASLQWSELRHELGEQKRALSRAFAHIDEMRERGEGVASEARQISSTPSAFAGGVL